MSIRPMDVQNVYLRMGEISREQDKEIKKEEREQGFQNKVRKSQNFVVGQVKEAHAEQTVREHEDRALPVRKKQGDEPGREDKQKLAQDMALPLAVLGGDALNGTSKNRAQDLDPDLGWNINIES